ncbi:unnamed protein product [Mytilus coruscus]|uniref:G-protein coupled receptors family 1 profile domain-containing protein n=1 Tax=Mytilus coruscus TaxID=42192 RepID=A0A6J8CSE1_MYTCO|nr:unnamed protein product [Mytilus coruscus]
MWKIERRTCLYQDYVFDCIWYPRVCCSYITYHYLSRILKTVFSSLKVQKNEESGAKKEIEKTDDDKNRPDIECKDMEMMTSSNQSMIPETKPDCVGQQAIKSRPVANNMESTASRKQRIINRRITNKLTVMFFIITTVFVLCFIPKVAIMGLEGIDEDFWENLSTSQRPEWNEEITNSLMPNIIMLSIYIALGAIGNVLVLLIYTFQMKEASDERYFIPILAFFDMIAAIYIGVLVYYIFQCFNQAKFSSNILCKTLVFFVGNTTYNSVFILFIIAIQRYMKVCMPLKQPMSIYVKRTALLLALLMSLICALPLPFVFGTTPFHNIDYGVSGMRYGRLKDGHPFVRAGYSVVAGLFVFVIVKSLIIVYGRIISTVFVGLQVNKKTYGLIRKETKQLM